MILPICFYGDPVLRKRAEPVVEITEEIRQLVADMIETVYAKDALGLAAPQVGKSLRIFVLREYVRLEGEEEKYTLSDMKVYINPKLSSPSQKKVVDVEGCLSIPGITLEVERPESITVTAMDLEGNTFTEELHGYNARIRMHENDHINGVLFIDRVDPKERLKIDPELNKIKKENVIS